MMLYNISQLFGGWGVIQSVGKWAEKQRFVVQALVTDQKCKGMLAAGAVPEHIQSTASAPPNAPSTRLGRPAHSSSVRVRV